MRSKLPDSASALKRDRDAAARDPGCANTT
jgi:hypothetical protein